MTGFYPVFFISLAAAEMKSKSSELWQPFILLTCDHVHLLLRWRGLVLDLADWREWDVCVQVQAQHEIMNLAIRWDGLWREKQTGFKAPLNEHVQVPSRPGPLWCWIMQSHWRATWTFADPSCPEPCGSTHLLPPGSLSHLNIKITTEWILSNVGQRIELRKWLWENLQLNCS